MWRDSTICVIASAGGHLQEAMRVVSLLHDHNIFYVTFALPQIPEILRGKEYHLVVDPHTSMLKYVINAIQVFVVYVKRKPRFVITTGAGIAVPMCVIARLLGSKVVFVESGARVKYPSRTALAFHKLRLANLFIVQWKSLLKYFPDAVYGGPLV